MAAWSVAPGAIKFDDIDALTPPAGPDAVQEQFNIAARVAAEIRKSKAVGEGPTYTVALSGVANVGHPNGDSITVTITNSN